MNLSLCCQSNVLNDQGIKFRTMTVTQFKKKPLNESLNVLCHRIIENFQTLKATVELCKSMNLAGMRIGSDLIPVINHPDLNLEFYKLPMQDEMMHAINEAKQAMKLSKLRFSAHPSEFISLTSDNPKVVANSIRDLIAHALVFELLDLPESYEAPLNIHIRKDGDPEMIYQNVVRSLKQCPACVTKRLVFENNDNKKGVWSIKNLITYFHVREGIPITYDNLHHEMLSDGLTRRQAFEAAYVTWQCHNTMPIFHYSEGINGTRKHADYAQSLPPDYGLPVIWEVELKAKDKAIKRMQKQLLQESKA
jgi:UV DNA damage endonuclease